MASAISTLPRTVGFFGLFVLFAGFVVIVAGLAKIQKKTNALGPAANIPVSTVQAYDTVFSYALLTPYSGAHGFQFSFIWFIIFFNLLNFVLSAAVLALPRFLYVGRAAALTLLAIATTLTINVVNNLQYLKRNPTAITVYGKRDIDVTFAGALLVTIGDFLIILAMGMWAHDTVGTSTSTYRNNASTDTYTSKRNTEPVIATTTV